LVVQGKTRADAIRTMRRALDEFVIEGIKTTIPFHRKVFNHQDFINGEFTTGFVERMNNRKPEDRERGGSTA
ncbi:MAG TPA: hypothetical protein VEI96_00115, partial [Thermodesulfovibrionales bacterium]|nr:hypothetical protein [Thermodesulfovibrionales bacterium]